MGRDSADVRYPLGRSGLVAFMRCGHWWVYTARVTAEELGEIARFNAASACRACSRRHHSAGAELPPMHARRN